MTKPAPVKTLLDLSKMRLDEATRELGTLISGEQVAAERLNLLITYRTEYRARFVAAAKTGIDRSSWHNYQTFLDRLDTSIAQAEEAVKQSRQHTLLGQQAWLGKKGKMRAFDTLVQRHHSREHYAAHHVEQKAQDEFSAYKFFGQKEET